MEFPGQAKGGVGGVRTAWNLFQSRSSSRGSRNAHFTPYRDIRDINIKYQWVVSGILSQLSQREGGKSRKIDHFTPYKHKYKVSVGGEWNSKSAESKGSEKSQKIDAKRHKTEVVGRILHAMCAHSSSTLTWHTHTLSPEHTQTPGHPTEFIAHSELE